MTEYYVPTKAGSGELTEKRSRFIGNVMRCSSEEEARAFIQSVRSGYHDARHNCWCYIIRNDGILRYSDDGEPQGTAGQPMLDLFRRSNVEDICCVVTRYFGGILLGPGGLVRAYTKCAALALEDAGISVVRLWKKYRYVSSYGLYERLRNEVVSAGGFIAETEFGADVTVFALLPEESHSVLNTRIRDLSSDSISIEFCCDELRDVPTDPFLEPIS